ncbi:amino acid adenylation domain-containing protein [Chloroflexi bacterium TSY]|nr:amino acid adenylation domain-containing protein [Chloroflexi bacterium TSY]
MTPEERQQILIEWNATGAEFPDLCVHQLFEARVAETPNAIALMNGEQAFTYAELNRRANQVAHHLVTLETQPENLIAICIERSVELFIGLLAIMKAGGAYVPLDASYPAARIDYMLRDSGVKILLTTTNIAAQLEPTVAALQDCLLICLDESDTGVQSVVDKEISVKVAPNNLAYCIYTSGSTGNPKGVLMEHGSLVNMLWWHHQTRKSVQSVKTLQFCAVSFDFSFHEIFSTLCLGGTLVLVPESVRQNPFALAEFIKAQQIEKLFLPVTALLQLAEAVDESTMPEFLREVITTGEQMQITPAVANLFGQTSAMLHNHYGATEFQDATTHTLCGDPHTWPMLMPVGRPLSNVQVYILDEMLQPVPIGEDGEFCIGGVGVARGYHNLPDLTDKKFIINPFGEGRLYRTGDLARYQPDGSIEHLGRMDHQVKIRGFRVELGEIEAVLMSHDVVRECAVVAREIAGDTQLVGYVVPNDENRTAFGELDGTLRVYLEETLPGHMVPAHFIQLKAMPLTPSGKLDRRSLPAPKHSRPGLSTPLVKPRTPTEQRLARIWQMHLALDTVGIHDNFFELGGTSLLLTQAHKSLRDTFALDLSAVSLFQYPTIQTLAQHIDTQNFDTQSSTDTNGVGKKETKQRKKQAHTHADIAIIGMAGRFPGAETIEQFWQNLCDGVESIIFFSDDELEQTSPDLLNNPNYVKAGAVLDGIEMFDATFFGYSPKEAAVTDPQQRTLLECAWEAFERAGYNPESYRGSVGVYAGSSLSTYLLNNIGSDLGIITEQPFIETDMAQFQAKIGNDRSYLATRISYKLNLKGPSVNVQTACSTSLVAVHMACQSLMSGECDMALAGGVSVVVPHRGGYLYEEGMVRSPDGHCRAFDAQAQGTIFGNGGGLVLLKRLQDAIDDNDSIVAVIKGSAINNDGALKVGYTAPGVDGQAEAISGALAVADIDASTIGYVETHGTATKLGDPIEVAGLTQAFQQNTDVDTLNPQQCAIGSVKTNIGHLDEAAGIAGLIKAALAVQHGQIPPSLHFLSPNPQIDFEQTPFFVNTTLREWKDNGTPRRAGVSSFGVGGTNSHVVLEEAPIKEPAGSSQLPEHSHHLLTLSAHSQEALHELAQRYLDHVENKPNINLADLCFTTNTGRKHFDQRVAVVAESQERLCRKLRTFSSVDSLQYTTPAQDNSDHARKIAFLFTGQGAQYENMGRHLYESQPVFRKTLDHCDQLLRPYLERSLLEVLYPESGQDSPIHETAYTQPALFALEYALYQLWRSWGIKPDIVMGHSVGEYVAACVAGVFSLEDGLKLIAERGRLMQALPRNGKMLSVAANEADITSLLAQFVDLDTSHVSVAAFNDPESLVLSGLDRTIDEIALQLMAAGFKCKELTVSHAFHSPLMTPILAEFAQVAQQVAYAEPRIKLISNVTGQLVDNEIATPEYWVQHVCQPVQFVEGMESIDAQGISVFIEMGPTPILLSMGKRCLPEHTSIWLPSLHQKRNDWERILTSLADLYMHGIEIDWGNWHRPYLRHRLQLPTYPFQRKRYWIDAPKDSHSAATRRRPPAKAANSVHPLLGQRLVLSRTEEIYFQTLVHPDSPLWVSDHKIFDNIIIPGVTYFEMALAAGKALKPDSTVWLEDVIISQALIIPDEGKTVQVVLSENEESAYDFEVLSLMDEESSWQPHAAGKLIIKDGVGIVDPINLTALQQHCTEEVPVDLLYHEELAREMDMGPMLRGVKQLWRSPKSFAEDHTAMTLAKIGLPEELIEEGKAYQFHPVLLDAGLQMVTVSYPEASHGQTYVPVGVEKLRVYDRLNNRSGSDLWCCAQYRPSQNGSDKADSDTPPSYLIADICLFDDEGYVLCMMEGVESVHVRREAMLRTQSTWKDWLYQITWQPQEKTTPTSPAGQWLVVTGADGSVPNLVTQLTAHGVHCTLLQIGTHFEQVAPNHYMINAQSHSEYEHVLQTLPDLQNVVYFGLSSEPENIDDISVTAQHLCIRLLYLTQSMLNLYPTPPILWLVTSDSQNLSQPNTDIAANNGLKGVVQSPLWALGRVIRLEHPELSCTCLDIETNIPTQELIDLLTMNPKALSSDNHHESQLLWHKGRVYAARLTRYQCALRGTCAIQRKGSYLITGGRGGIGLQIARWLAEQGAGHLILLGRSEPTPEVSRALDELEATGTTITVAQSDVCDQRALSDIRSHLIYPLRGIIHAAGVLDDGILQHQTAERFADVMEPKVQGAWNLHCLTVDQPLDFFVLFSSVSPLLGAAGQSSYAAANAFLDGLASYRHGLGLPCLSINWGSWSEVGMTARIGLVEQLEKRGEGVLSPQAGVEIFGQLLREPTAQIGVMPIDWPRFLQNEENASPFYQKFSTFAEKSQNNTSRNHKIAPMRFRRQLEDASSHERPLLLENHIRRQIADILGMELSELPYEENIGFAALGMDSLTSIELRNRLQRSLDCSLPATFAFDYGTVEKALAYLSNAILVPLEASDGVDGVDRQQASDEEPDQEMSPAVPTTRVQEDEAESLEAIFAELSKQVEG